MKFFSLGLRKNVRMEIGRLLTELVRFPREVSAGRREKVAYLSLDRDRVEEAAAEPKQGLASSGLIIFGLPRVTIKLLFGRGY